MDEQVKPSAVNKEVLKKLQGYAGTLALMEEMLSLVKGEEPLQLRLGRLVIDMEVGDESYDLTRALILTKYETLYNQTVSVYNLLKKEL